MVAHIGDYPLASELMASQATILLPLYTLRAECRQCMGMGGKCRVLSGHL